MDYNATDANRYMAMIRAKQKQLKGAKVRRPWNVGFEIARFAAKGIREFRQHKRVSYPTDTTPEKWEEELKELEWVLNQVANDYPSSPYNSAWRLYWYHKNTTPKPNYDDYKDAEKSYYERIDDGLQSFAYRLYDLWD